MSDETEKDVFDENLSQLLRHAQGPPRMGARQKERLLRQLESQFERAAVAGRGRVIMNRPFALWLRVAAAALVIFLVGTLLFLPYRPTKEFGLRPRGPSKFSLADGTVLYPKGKPKYTVAGKRHLILEQGQILLFVARSDEPFVVETPRARAEAHGTTFTVAATAGSTFVAVAQGRVNVSNSSGRFEVRAGQQATALKTGPPSRERAPRFTYLVNWARDLLESKDLFETETHSSGELVAVDPWGQPVRLELRRYHIDVVIENGIARTTIDQTFFNHLNWQIEGTFYFPLPPDASLSRLAMYVNGVLNEGGMVERQYGRQVYESIVYRRRDPALLEMMEGNVFKMRVFPLFGRQEKRIVLSYTQTLPQLYGTLRYWFPMEHTNDKAGKLSIRVRVKNAAGRAKALSSTHDVKTDIDGHDLDISYEAHDVPPNQDFLLHLVPEDGDGPGLPFATFRQNGSRFLFARLQPRLDAAVETKPRQWFIINDVSASRSSVDVKAQAYVIERLLEEADDEDSFALINLDTQARVWREELMSVRDARGADAVAFAGVDERMGATNVEAALKAVSDLIDKSGADNPYVAYLGDGVATDGITETERLAGRLHKSCVFIGLGIGKKVDARFLQAAADATNGLFTTVNPSEDIRWRIFDLIAALNTPRLVDINIAFADDSGKEMKLEAYPSTGTVSDGEVLTVLARTDREPPARMKLTGRVGQKRFEKEYDLIAAAPGAAYTPRLWASARINHLLRQSAAEHKSEIIKLAKEYYVVTPFTSLIVLENEADYKKWKVEMGRRDHWQLYPAPKKIRVVREPLEHQPWREPERAVKGTPGHPKTVEEIVDSVQFRVQVPLYGYYPYQHHRRRTERFRLQALLSGRLPVAGYGSIAPLLPTPVEESETSVRPILGMGPLVAGGVLWRAEQKSKGEELMPFQSLPWSRDGRQSGFMFPPLDPNAPFGGFLRSGSGDAARIGGGGLLLGTDGLYYKHHAIHWASGRERRLKLAIIGDIPALGYLFDNSYSMAGSFLLADGQALSREFIRTAIRPGTWGPALRLKPPPAAPMPEDLLATYSELTVDYFRPLGGELLKRQHAHVFEKARIGRWFQDRERIRSYNRRYGHWGYGDWDDRGAGRAIVAGDELAEAYLPMMVLARDRDALLDTAQLPELEEDLPAAPLLLRGYAHAVGAVPGTLTTLAVDRLLPLREKLRAMRPGKRRDKVLAALDRLVERLPKLSALAENTGVFWSYQGWSVLPTRWEFQQPQCQAWTGSRAMVDLTRYAPALESTWGDVAELVLAAFGKEPRGRVEAAAAERITAARRRTPNMLIKYVNKKGDVLFKLWAGREDRFAWSTTSSMYLREDFVCDGTSLYHVYPELGLAARRAAGRRLAGIRGLVPHLMPPPEELARVFNVALETVNGENTTIRLSPLPPRKAAKAKRPKLEIFVTFDARGFLRGQTWAVDGTTKLTCTYTYKDGKAEGTWSAGDQSALAFSYRVDLPEPRLDPFVPKLKNIVVLDMPLRRPTHYGALLKELGDDPAKLAERTRLRRHLTLAQIQDFGWQYPWGHVHQAYQTLWAALQERLKAGQTKVPAGDMTLIGSTGYAYSDWNSKEFELPGYPLMQYWRGLGDTGKMKEAAAAEENRGTFVGHLTAYSVTHYGGADRAKVARRLMREYPESPLLYAAAIYCGGNEDVWLELARLPRWRFVALSSAAQHGQTDKIARAFEDFHKEMTEKGWEVPVSSPMATALKKSSKRWHGVVNQWFRLAMKSKDVGALLRFAEFAHPHGEKDLASVAIDRARELMGKELPLTWKLALAQSQWAMGLRAEAWKAYEEIFAALKKAAIEPSPALLASAARLAQQVNKPKLAVDYELRAIEAEKPYMPKRINVYLFRQRYQWLWSQLTGRVGQCASAVKATPGSHQAKRELHEAVERAAGVWRMWKQVDAGNTQLYQQLASLHRTADDNATAWRVLSTIIDEKPKDGQSYYQVGAWYVSQGDREAGQGWYARAYEVEPTNGDWIWHRAELLRQMGRKDEARKLYEEMVNKKWQPRFQHYNRNAQERLKKL